MEAKPRCRKLANVPISSKISAVGLGYVLAPLPLDIRMGRRFHVPLAAMHYFCSADAQRDLVFRLWQDPCAAGPLTAVYTKGASLETRAREACDGRIHALQLPAFSSYNNPSYGVTFRYPRNYFLDDALESEDAPILEARQKLAAQQPGATLVATVTIPPDAYPNTTFVSGTLQLIVNPRVTRETCQSFAVPLDEAYTFGATSIQGTAFNWRQRRSAAAGTGFLNRDYAGYSNGTCYEFFLEIVTGSNPDLDPGIKDADEVKIMRQLEKLVLSLQIHNPHASYNPL